MKSVEGCVHEIFSKRPFLCSPQRSAPGFPQSHSPMVPPWQGCSESSQASIGRLSSGAAQEIMGEGLGLEVKVRGEVRLG